MTPHELTPDLLEALAFAITGVCSVAWWGWMFNEARRLDEQLQQQHENDQAALNDTRPR